MLWLGIYALKGTDSYAGQRRMTMDDEEELFGSAMTKLIIGEELNENEKKAVSDYIRLCELIERAEARKD